MGAERRTGKKQEGEGKQGETGDKECARRCDNDLGQTTCGSCSDTGSRDRNSRSNHHTINRFLANKRRERSDEVRKK
jgi:hypothetical protein